MTTTTRDRFGAARLDSARVIALAWVVVAAVLAVASADPARAQGQEPAGPIVIDELVAANTILRDDFGATSDWVELHNPTGDSVDLAGWTLADDANSWALPSLSIGSGQRLVIWASGRNRAGPPPHADFRLASAGETLRLARPDGSLADSVTYPALGDDQAWGRDGSGRVGYLLTPTPGTSNSALAPGVVTLVTPPQAFTNTLAVTLAADLAPGESIRYTTNGAAVTATSRAYAGPISISSSTVVRAAVVGSGGVGPEVSGGYVGVTAQLAARTSDLPIVLVQSTGAVGTTDQDAIVSVIDREADGRARVLGAADYTGFAGLRIRGDSSSGFPKKQFKFELWDNPGGESRDASLLGMGSDDDWGLYAPGYFDRAMINNPFMYELGHRIGVPAPDYQFVELWLEDSTGMVGEGDYRGLYLLRETIEIDDARVDLTEHTPTSAGPDGGYLIRHDRADNCCRTIRTIGNGTVVAVEAPRSGEITGAQLSYIDGWWDQMRAAADSRNRANIERYIDLDALIDYWLLVILSGDPDGLRLSTYFYKEANGLLGGGPLWDYDRTMGSVDYRNDTLAEAVGWGYGGSQLLRNYDFFGDLWAVPQVQAQLRARWAELRAGELSNAQIGSVITGLRDEILSTYPRELSRWNGNGYGPRRGNGLVGEVSFLHQFVQTRLNWLDGQLTSGTRPTVSNPGRIVTDENAAVSYRFAVSGGQAFDFASTDLPAGLTLDQSGLLSGRVGFGDATTVPVTVTVTNQAGGATAVSFMIEVRPSFTGPAAVLLNEYNAVEPGGLLDAGGSDKTFGRVAGNGGDWFEVVTIEDHLDLTGWRFDIYTNGASGVVQTASLQLGDDPLLGDLRAGTIITVAESVPDDLSYDPDGGDWTLNLQANNAQQGAMWANQTGFDTNNTKWRLVVRDRTDAIRAPIAGETEPWDDANLGVSGAEVMILGTDPGPRPDLVADYTDSTESSFGAPNPIGDGAAQDFDALRPDIEAAGDVDCDGDVDIGDALAIAQYTVLIRTESGCPLSDPSGSIDLSGGDINRDDRVDIGDALVISQCTVGIDTGYCPEPSSR